MRPVDIYEVRGQVQDAARKEEADADGEWPKILRGPFKSGKVSLSWGRGRIKWYDSLEEAERAAGKRLVLTDRSSPTDRDSLLDTDNSVPPVPRANAPYRAPVGKPSLAERLSPSHASDELSGLREKITPDFIANARKLTHQEAAAYRDKIYKVLCRVFGYMDEIITNTSHLRYPGEVAHIWTRIDSNDTYILVDSLLNAGVSSKAGAVIVRGLSDLWDQFEVGLILAPKFLETWKWYIDHPLLRGVQQ